MDAQNVVELLESKWQSIGKQLGEKWDKFISSLPSPRNRPALTWNASLTTSAL